MISKWRECFGDGSTNRTSATYLTDQGGVYLASDGYFLKFPER